MAKDPSSYLFFFLGYLRWFLYVTRALNALYLTYFVDQAGLKLTELSLPLPPAC